MTFWWNSTGFLREKGITVKCHENVMKFQCHSMGLKFLVHFDGILMEKVHGIVMALDVNFDQNSHGNQWWHFIIRVDRIDPVKNVTWIFSCLFDGSLVKIHTQFQSPDNRILWDVTGMSWDLMSSFDIFFGRKRRHNSMEKSWHFDGIQQDFYEKKASP